MKSQAVKKDGTDETSTNNYQSRLRNIPKEGRFYVNRDGSLVSNFISCTRIWCNLPSALWFLFVLQNRVVVTTFVKMAILEAIRSLIRVSAAIFEGVARIYVIFGRFVHVISTAVSVVVTPYMFAASQLARMFSACRSAWNWTISKAKKFVKMLTVLSLALLVFVVTYLYYVRLHIKHER